MRWIWIDKFVEFESAKRAVAIKNVCLSEEYLHDHFPGYPVMPASLLIEGLAQTGGVLVGEAKGFREKVILAKVSWARFYSLARPGDQLHLEVVVENMNDEAASIRGSIRCGERVIGEVQLIFSHIDKNMAGMEFPQENFVFHERFMELLEIFKCGDGAKRRE